MEHSSCWRSDSQLKCQIRVRVKIDLLLPFLLPDFCIIFASSHWNWWHACLLDVVLFAFWIPALEAAICFTSGFSLCSA